MFPLTILAFAFADLHGQGDSLSDRSATAAPQVVHVAPNRPLSNLRQKTVPYGSREIQHDSGSWQLKNSSGIWYYIIPVAEEKGNQSVIVR